MQQYARQTQKQSGNPPGAISAIAQAAAAMRENIPAEIQSLHSFCCWRMEPRVEGERPTKIGRHPRTGHRAKSNDPATHATFDESINAFVHSAQAHEPYRGIFFALAEPYVGLDWDDCVDPITLAIAPAVQDMLAWFDSYCEFSPSLTGIKMIIRGAMPTADGRGKNFRPKTTWDDGLGPIEFYGTKRFFALTGRKVPGAPAVINERSQKLAVLYSRLYPPRPVKPAMKIAEIGDIDERTRAERCQRYVDRMPASISGQRGHDRLLAVACTAFRFGLSESSALSVLRDFNRRCQPAWSDAEIERKWSEAAKVCGSSDFGSKLPDRRNVSVYSPRRTVTYTTSAGDI